MSRPQLPHPMLSSHTYPHTHIAVFVQRSTRGPHKSPGLAYISCLPPNAHDSLLARLPSVTRGAAVPIHHRFSAGIFTGDLGSYCIMLDRAKGVVELRHSGRSWMFNRSVLRFRTGQGSPLAQPGAPPVDFETLRWVGLVPGESAAGAAEGVYFENVFVLPEARLEATLTAVVPPALLLLAAAGPAVGGGVVAAAAAAAAANPAAARGGAGGPPPPNVAPTAATVGPAAFVAGTIPAAAPLPACPEGVRCLRFMDSTHVRTVRHSFSKPVCKNARACSTFFTENPAHCKESTHVCRRGAACVKQGDLDHLASHIHILLPPCAHGKGCADYLVPSHREASSHPGVPDILIPCKDGAGCPKIRGAKHLDTYKH